jgi:gluconokinase
MERAALEVGHAAKLPTYSQRVLARPVPVTTLVVMGVSGSGKTTVARALAERLGRTYVEGDDLHSAANVAKMRAGTPLDDTDREPWLDRIAEQIGGWEAAGVSAVLTCSSLKRAYRDRLRAGHESVLFVHVRVDEQTLRERLARRSGHYMPPSLLTSQLADLEPLDPDELGLTVDGGGYLNEVTEQIVTSLA